MPNYSKLHDLISHRVTIEYDTGARITGYLASCQPSAGPVEFAVLSDARLIDSRGRHIHNGGTTGSRSFMGFDLKTRRGVVVLASTGSSLVDRLGGIMFDVLDGTAKPPGAQPTAAQLASYAGSYDFTGTKLAIVTANNRLYIEGPGEPRHRLVPVNDVAFWIEALQSVAFFQKEGDAVKQVVFQVGDRQLVAPRVP